MSSILNVEQREHVSEDRYEDVLARFYDATGSVEEGFSSIAETATDADDFQRIFKEREGSSGLMRFMVTDHGSWLTRFYNQPTRATMIVLGNPLVAITMLKHDIGAGLNVPTRMYIYEGPDGRTHVVYDLPSTQMQNLSEDAREAARKLDEKLIAFATSITGESA